MSDQDYESFLDKANQDTGASKDQAQSKSKSVGIKSVDTDVPVELEKVDEIYVSDADEPFEPLSLKYKGDGLPSADEFGKLVGETVESIKQKDFDPRGQYKKVIDAVKKAGDGDVSFFRAELDSTRVQYLIVSLDSKNNKLVGLKALAIES
ncbi:hypothetical protein BT63DRAFT_425634 [Microthyrium microscopicum]|uniref:Uncharacterized protein n=1 Tax=Microthyrium microscopicum TaxID=703497 RepID=A0A6A6U8L1_9PEZI|nr:hypothetical protein BT63DRAFT_425634 [Microthyrium microscopicum]